MVAIQYLCGKCFFVVVVVVHIDYSLFMSVYLPLSWAVGHSVSIDSPLWILNITLRFYFLKTYCDYAMQHISTLHG